MVDRNLSLLGIGLATGISHIDHYESDGSVMVFVGQIIIKERNSQKRSEGAQVSNLLNFPYLQCDFSLVVCEPFFAFG